MSMRLPHPLRIRTGYRRVAVAVLPSDAARGRDDILARRLLIQNVATGIFVLDDGASIRSVPQRWARAIDSQPVSPSPPIQNWISFHDSPDPSVLRYSLG